MNALRQQKIELENQLNSVQTVNEGEAIRNLRTENIELKRKLEEKHKKLVDTRNELLKKLKAAEEMADGYKRQCESIGKQLQQAFNDVEILEDMLARNSSTFTNLEAVRDKILGKTRSNELNTARRIINKFIEELNESTKISKSETITNSSIQENKENSSKSTWEQRIDNFLSEVSNA